MAEAVHHRLARHFTTLLGRSTVFSETRPTADSKVRQVYAVYRVIPDEIPMVVKADLPLLGSFAGALVGLPDQEVTQHLAADPLEELMRDAIYEVLNITGSVIMIDHRAVLAAMVTDPKKIEGAAAILLTRPANRLEFNVTVNGYQGGKLAVFC
jgi:hypothetical protein